MPTPAWLEHTVIQGLGAEKSMLFRGNQEPLKCSEQTGGPPQGLHRERLEGERKTEGCRNVYSSPSLWEPYFGARWQTDFRPEADSDCDCLECCKKRIPTCTWTQREECVIHW